VTPVGCKWVYDLDTDGAIEARIQSGPAGLGKLVLWNLRSSPPPQRWFSRRRGTKKILPEAT
jgi:hypothetical protein